MAQLAGSSRLLRAINETAALGHLLERGPLTRADLRELTGLAKPTTSDVLRRLRDAGLVKVVGHTSSGPGPNAEVYAVNPDAAYGAGVSLRTRDGSLVAAVCDLAGTVRARRAIAADAASADPALAAADAVAAACRQARIPLRRLHHVRLGVPGSDRKSWPGLAGELRAKLRTTAEVDTAANLAAVAERRRGAAADADGFALLWLGEDGVDLAIDLGGRLMRGAGEIGHMPVGLPADGGARSFRDLVCGSAIRELAERHGIVAGSGRAAVALAAGRPDGALLGVLADRVAAGLAAVIAVLDPPLIVLAGEVGAAAGRPLSDAVTAALRRLPVPRTPVAATGVTEDAVLLGALDAALDAVRTNLLGVKA